MVSMAATSATSAGNTYSRYVGLFILSRVSLPISRVRFTTPLKQMHPRPVKHVSASKYREDRELAWRDYPATDAAEPVPAEQRVAVRELAVPNDLLAAFGAHCSDTSVHANGMAAVDEFALLAADVCAEMNTRHYTPPPSVPTPQAIGPPAPVFINPSSRQDIVRDPFTGQVYPANAVPETRGTLRDEDLIARAQQTSGGLRVFGGARRRMTVRAPPLRLILPADLMTWPRVPWSFPVFVVHPGFGAGLVTHYIATETATGFGNAGLYFAVKKFTPLGPVPSEPYSLGLYAVPSMFAQRMELAVAQLFPAENLVVIDDYRGDQYSVSFVDFRTTSDRRYEIARRALLLQYPALLADMFATRLRTSAPPDMLPGGTVTPPALAGAAPLMVVTPPMRPIAGT